VERKKSISTKNDFDSNRKRKTIHSSIPRGGKKPGGGPKGWGNMNKKTLGRSKKKREKQGLFVKKGREGREKCKSWGNRVSRRTDGENFNEKKAQCRKRGGVRKPRSQKKKGRRNWFKGKLNKKNIKEYR